MVYCVLGTGMVSRRAEGFWDSGTSVASGVLDSSVASGFQVSTWIMGFWVLAWSPIEQWTSSGVMDWGMEIRGGNIITKTGWALRSVVGLWVESYLGFQVPAWSPVEQ